MDRVIGYFVGKNLLFILCFLSDSQVGSNSPGAIAYTFLVVSAPNPATAALAIARKVTYVTGIFVFTVVFPMMQSPCYARPLHIPFELPFHCSSLLQQLLHPFAQRIADQEVALGIAVPVVSVAGIG